MIRIIASREDRGLHGAGPSPSRAGSARVQKRNVKYTFLFWRKGDHGKACTGVLYQAE